MGVLIGLFCVLLVLSALVGVDGTEELRVITPQSLKNNFSAGLIPDSPALFGVPAYREARQGILLRAVPNNGCSAFDTSSWPGGPDGGVNKIALIDRGECSFVTKVRNAENAGCTAAIVVNNVPGDFFTFDGG